jgi:hypothetical protein
VKEAEFKLDFVGQGNQVPSHELLDAEENRNMLLVELAGHFLVM